MEACSYPPFRKIPTFLRFEDMPVNAHAMRFLAGCCCLAASLACAAEPDRSAQSPPAQAHPLKFELDIQPILTARGCNSGPCHGKARGQNGFALSLLAFDPDF